MLGPEQASPVTFPSRPNMTQRALPSGLSPGSEYSVLLIPHSVLLFIHIHASHFTGVCVSLFLFVHSSVFLSSFLSICLSVCRYFCPSVCLSFFLFVRLAICLTLILSLGLSFFLCLSCRLFFSVPLLNTAIQTANGSPNGAPRKKTPIL